MRRERRLICSVLLAAGGGVAAQDVPHLSAVEVRAQVENLEGLAIAGSEGVVFPASVWRLCPCNGRARRWRWCPD